MKRIVLFDPSYGTSNLGDVIINDAIMREMDFLFRQNFLVRYSTHNPVLSGLQQLRPSPIRRNTEIADLKFIGGTNILKNNLFKIIPGWNISLGSARLYSGAICIGAGRALTGDGQINRYTRAIYQKALSPDDVHSVRDARSKQFLESLGYRAIDTGCPTTWSLTREATSGICAERSGHVISTVTDYSPDLAADSEMLRVLLKRYETVSVWVQGVNDLEYLRRLPNFDKLHIIPPSLHAYRDALRSPDVEYVGTRLHAGIFAMQNGARASIIAVDHRALDMAASIGIHTISRKDIHILEDFINRSQKTELNIDSQSINKWKSQFSTDV